MAAALRPVRVSFVSSHALGGGSERYLELLLEGLGSDWVAGVIVLQEGPFVERLRAAGWPVEVVQAPARAGMLRAALALRKVLARQRPQVIHANGIKAALVASLATLGGRRPPVLWLKHDYSWDGPLARAVAVGSARVVAVSSAITTTFGARQRRKLSVVPNGVPDPAIDLDAARRRVLDIAGGEAPPVVATLVGRLHPAKGQREVIEAAPRVLERHPELRFLLVGGEDPTQPEYARALRGRVAELGLEQKVVFTGHQENAPELIAGSDMLVLPSVPDERGYGREACPFALLEAMSVGTPVVAYADGGVPEALGDCGVLVDPGDRDALADAIAGLARSPDEAGRLRDCGRRRVAGRNGLEGMVAAMRRHYSDLAR